MIQSIDKGSDMRTTPYRLIIVLFLATLFVSNCKGGSSGTGAAPDSTKNANSSNPQPPTPAQTSASSKPGDVAPAKETGATPKLVGTYVMSEIHESGVATIISELKTVIHFSDDGTYSRASSNKGKIYHTDSGKFRIDGGDKLVLTIQVSRKGMENKMHDPPLQKVHKFELSSGGEELRMTSDSGKVALFRRSDTVPK
jgi:hypothetical protein